MRAHTHTNARERESSSVDERAVFCLQVIPLKKRGDFAVMLALLIFSIM